MTVDDAEARRYWRRCWLESLFMFASLVFQFRAWVRRSEGVCNYEEILEGYFTDLHIQDGFALALDDGLISQEEVRLVEAFHKSLDSFEWQGDDDELPSDPGWLKVVSEARKAWLNVKVTLHDTDERKLVAEMEEQYGCISGESKLPLELYNELCGIERSQFVLENWAKDLRHHHLRRRLAKGANQVKESYPKRLVAWIRRAIKAFG